MVWERDLRWRAAFIQPMRWSDGDPVDGKYPSGRMTYANDPDFGRELADLGDNLTPPASSSWINLRRTSAAREYVRAIEAFCRTWGLDRFQGHRRYLGERLVDLWIRERQRLGPALPPSAIVSGLVGAGPGPVLELGSLPAWDVTRESRTTAAQRWSGLRTQATVRAELTETADAAEAAGLVFEDAPTSDPRWHTIAARNLQALYWRSADGLSFEAIAERMREGAEDVDALEARVRKAIQRTAALVGIDDSGWYGIRG